MRETAGIKRACAPRRTVWAPVPCSTSCSLPGASRWAKDTDETGDSRSLPQLSQEKSVAPFAPAAAFGVGDAVLALWGHRWFPGVVEEVIAGGHAFRIVWDDDDACNEIPARHVRRNPRPAQDDSGSGDDAQPQRMAPQDVGESPAAARRKLAEQKALDDAAAARRREATRKRRAELEEAARLRKSEEDARHDAARKARAEAVAKRQAADARRRDEARARLREARALACRHPAEIRRAYAKELAGDLAAIRKAYAKEQSREQPRKKRPQPRSKEETKRAKVEAVRRLRAKRAAERARGRERCNLHRHEWVHVSER